MRIVFGGAFNGKRQFVRDLIAGHDVKWHEGELPEAVENSTVIAGLEKWVKQQLQQRATEQIIMERIKQLAEFQNSGAHIWILTDMNRGIVPVDPIERELRDVIGRIYQYLFAEAEQVTRIWYGIPQTLKGGDKDENLYENGR